MKTISSLAAILSLGLIAWTTNVLQGRERTTDELLLDARWSELAARTETPALLAGISAVFVNDNRRATELFARAGESDRSAWLAWAGELSRAHPRSAAAHFAHGDALARSGELEGALQSYGRALAIDDAFVPANLGRGVALGMLARWDEAKGALEHTSALAPELAEAHASLGTMLLCRRAVERAADEFEAALALDPRHALAMNGLGCALYADNRPAEAMQAFGKANDELPLALFQGNARALAVGFEHWLLPGDENSPLLRYTDFLDWDALRALSEQPADVIGLMHGSPLPAIPDANVLERLNAALSEPGFRERFGLAYAEPEQLDALVRNRRALERSYPLLLADHTDRNPGTQFTFRGFKNMDAHKQGLSASRIVQGQFNMDHISRPIAHAMESSKIPVVKFLGKEYGKHIELSTHKNKLEFERRGIDPEILQPGGVSMRLVSEFDAGNDWPVLTWYGLMQATPLDASQVYAERR